MSNLYRHLKTNRVYVLLHKATDATNSAFDREVIVYQSTLDGAVYVRNSGEFKSKFKELDSTNLQDLLDGVNGTSKFPNKYKIQKIDGGCHICEVSLVPTLKDVESWIMGECYGELIYGDLVKEEIDAFKTKYTSDKSTATFIVTMG